MERRASFLFCFGFLVAAFRPQPCAGVTSAGGVHRRTAEEDGIDIFGCSQHAAVGAAPASTSGPAPFVPSRGSAALRSARPTTVLGPHGLRLSFTLAAGRAPLPAREALRFPCRPTRRLHRVRRHHR
ncbi:unnamed protein product [Prorocentrum cordatum]|uniref:Secreted protein n=1 Tax=Prorocentrum cordatum TaxID=2364126 RepID=A0ABN9YFL5_9DINO|nr:unnamed protein product [Polarella glacialis]